MEKYSEGKIHKIEWAWNKEWKIIYANTVYNYLSGEIIESVALSLSTMNEQAIANVRFIYLSFSLEYST